MLFEYTYRSGGPVREMRVHLDTDEIHIEQVDNEDDYTMYEYQFRGDSNIAGYVTEENLTVLRDTIDDAIETNHATGEFNTDE